MFVSFLFLFLVAAADFVGKSEVASGFCCLEVQFFGFYEAFVLCRGFRIGERCKRRLERINFVYNLSRKRCIRSDYLIDKVLVTENYLGGFCADFAVICITIQRIPGIAHSGIRLLEECFILKEMRHQALVFLGTFLKVRILVNESFRPLAVFHSLTAHINTVADDRAVYTGDILCNNESNVAPAFLIKRIKRFFVFKRLC